MNKAIVACSLLAMTVPARAANLQTDVGLVARSFFSDNIFLEPTESESDTAIQILPHVTASWASRRMRADFAYGPSALFYMNNDDLNNLYHILQLNSRAELVEKIFFLNVRANANQQVINPSSRAAFDAVANPDAFTQTASISVIPDIRVPVVTGRYAEVRIRPGINYTFAADTADGARNAGATGTDTRVDILSGDFFTRMPWSVRYRKEVFARDTDDGIGRADGTLGYRFSPRYRLNATMGYDNGRYASTNDNSGFRWRLSGIWTPTPRTSLTLGIGEAFFGDDWLLVFRHRHKRTVWTADYQRQIEDAAREIRERDVVSFQDPFGNRILDPLVASSTGVEVGSPALTDGVYVRDRFNAGVNFRSGRTTVDLTLRYDRRDYQDQDLDTRDGRVRLNLSRTLSKRLSAHTGLDYWAHDEDSPASFDYRQYRFRMGLSYRLGSRTTASLDLLRTDRSSGEPLNEYTENRMDLSISYSWNPRL